MTGVSARVDAWTWSVRVFRTRSEAATACRAGHVRVNDAPAKPGQRIVPGDVVRIRRGGLTRILRVEKPVSRRVGAPEAATCYRDESPPPPPPEVVASIPRRDRGAGRPTKRERRDMERLTGRGSGDARM